MRRLYQLVALRIVRSCLLTMPTTFQPVPQQFDVCVGCMIESIWDNIQISTLDLNACGFWTEQSIWREIVMIVPK